MDLALASFHKYGQRKQQQEAVGGFPVGWFCYAHPLNQAYRYGLQKRRCTYLSLIQLTLEWLTGTHASLR